MRRRQVGLSLIELMIAMTIGLLLSGAVLGAYVNAVRSLSQDERHARMQENGRYALRLVAEDLMMADFWGQMTSTDTMTTSLTVPTGNCAEEIDLYDADTAIWFNNEHSGDTHFTPCTTITDDQRASTDLVVIKRSAGAPTAETFVDVNDVDGDSNTSETLTIGASDLEDERVYLRTNGTNAEFIDDATGGNAPGLGEGDWLYAPRLYYVRDFYDTSGDGIPALCRLDMDDDDTGFDDTPQCVAEGIEDLHLQFGIDTDTDGVANRCAADPSLADMESAVSARVYVLARASEADPSYSNTKTYVLGDETVTVNDGFYRSVFSTTVSLRNSVNRSLIQ